MSAGLRLSGVGVAFGQVSVLSAASLQVRPGRVTAIVGPSGCGKSTLLRAVAGLEPLRSGRVCWDGQDLAGVPTHRRGFALMFQDGQLFGHLDVAANVAYPLRLRRVPKARRAERVRELLDLVGLGGLEDRLPATLSGGERQRVALARAFAVQPRLLLLDEPLSALDAGLRGRLALDLRDLLRASGTTALMVTHDHEEAFAVADEIAVMRAGRIVQQGAIDEVWRSPVDADTALFLGYAAVLDGDPAAVLAGAAGLSWSGSGWSGSGWSGSGWSGPELAVRRSALVASAEQDGLASDGLASDGLAGVVQSLRTTPGQLRLVVDLDRVGQIDAVAALDAHLAPGDRVRLRVDPTRVAVIGGSAAGGGLS